MDIVIDTSPLASGHKTRGIGRYTRHLSESLVALSSGHRFYLTSEVDTVDHPDIVHYPYFDLFHSHLPWFPPAPLEVVTIHDLIPLRFKDTFRPGLRSGVNLWAQLRLIRRAAAVITDSECSKKDIIEFLRVPSNLIRVIPLGVDAAFRKQPQDVTDRVLRSFGLPQRYVLYVGDVNANKNLLPLIDAVSAIGGLSLVMVSHTFKNQASAEVKQIKEKIAVTGASERFFLLDDVQLDPVDSLAALYSGATMYIQPSIYEGFGLPVLEAMACGTAVISTRSASLPEVAGDAAYYSGASATELERALRALLRDDSQRAILVRKGKKRAKQFTWTRTARRTVDVYESIGKTGHGS